MRISEPEMVAGRQTESRPDGLAPGLLLKAYPLRGLGRLQADLFFPPFCLFLFPYRDRRANVAGWLWPYEEQ